MNISRAQRIAADALPVLKEQLRRLNIAIHELEALGPVMAQRRRGRPPNWMRHRNETNLLVMTAGGGRAG